MGILSIANANKIARSIFCLLFQLVSLLTKRACIKAGPLCIRTSGTTSFSFKFNDSFTLLFYPITTTTACKLEKKKNVYKSMCYQVCERRVHIFLSVSSLLLSVYHSASPSSALQQTEKKRIVHVFIKTTFRAGTFRKVEVFAKPSWYIEPEPLCSGYSAIVNPLYSIHSRLHCLSIKV